VTAGFTQGDSAAAIVLGAVLSYLSIRFVYHNATELTDVISPKLVAAVRKAASETEGVLECKDIKVRRVGREIFVDATVSLRGHMSFEAAHSTSDLVEENIGRGVAEMGLVASPEGITVHFEPTSRGSTAESIVEQAARKVDGVRGVHNILVSRVEGTDSIEVSLHVQVRRDASLSEAHSLSDAVEDSIRKSLNGADNITVHLEPNLPELPGVRPVTDQVEQSVRETVLASSDIERVDKIVAYRADQNTLKIDIQCVFKKSLGSEMTIEQIHERVSEIERRLRDHHPGSIITIHAEPGT
jgi:divalent metal cation (Fe/Co/Zn/Cd) transporter